ncbi:SlyX family protein [Gammaproteobacteria bacterium]|nr:SlyX family protein [Gammaproteobacteria bacterium]
MTNKKKKVDSLWLAAERRIVQLEEKISHQERLTDELNKFVFEQSSSLDFIIGELGLIREQLSGYKREADVSDSTPETERPPHY